MKNLLAFCRFNTYNFNVGYRKLDDFLELAKYRDERIHFIGIGGCSMSGLALILKNLGYNVSGSDANTSMFTDALETAGVSFSIGHNPALVEGAGLVIRSAAIKPENPEYIRARSLNIPVLKRSVLLGLLSRDFSSVVCVAGCHGKTTITSMLARILSDTDIDPTIHVGGMVDFLGGGVKLGESEYFVTEACEYVKSFLTLHPNFILVNNIDDDHLDCYRDLDEIIDTFSEFVKKLPPLGKLFLNSDDENAMKMRSVTDCEVVTYSVQSGADYCLCSMVFDEMGNPSYDLFFKDQLVCRVSLQVPGAHNALNSLAAICLAHSIFGIDPSSAAASLTKYRLVGRRFELVGERDGVKIFHDYAHHPSEIIACLSAAKNYPHSKLWVLFQCNSFTRARTLKEKYGKSFFDADFVLMPDLYPGRDIDRGDIHARDLVNEINLNTGNCVYLPTFEDIKEYLEEHWGQGDIVVTLGSGDVNKQQMVLLG